MNNKNNSVLDLQNSTNTRTGLQDYRELIQKSGKSSHLVNLVPQTSFTTTLYQKNMIQGTLNYLKKRV